MFENKRIRGIHASRYIASWVKGGGNLGYEFEGRFDFYDWLKSLGLDKDEAQYIYNLADNGKLELETSARQFVKTLND